MCMSEKEVYRVDTLEQSKIRILEWQLCCHNPFITLNISPLAIICAIRQTFQHMSSFESDEHVCQNVSLVAQKNLCGTRFFPFFYLRFIKSFMSKTLGHLALSTLQKQTVAFPERFLSCFQAPYQNILPRLELLKKQFTYLKHFYLMPVCMYACSWVHYVWSGQFSVCMHLCEIFLKYLAMCVMCMLLDTLKFFLFPKANCL